MTDQSEYVFTYENIPVGNYEFKLVFNNEMDTTQNGWQHNAGGDYGVQYTNWSTPVGWKENASNINFSLAAASSVSIRVLMDTYQYAIDLGDPAYAVNIIQPENGTITASPATAQEGDTVTLTITPNAGYAFDSCSVSGTAGAVTVTNNQFTMPASNVTVTAVFKRVEGYSLVTFDADGGSGTMVNAAVVTGSTYTLPDSRFIAPFHHKFLIWQIGNTRYSAGSQITVTGDTVVKAVWEKIPPTITDMEITRMPDKLTYYAGENFDHTGLVVTVYYSDGTTAPFTGYIQNSQNASNLKYGQQTVSFTCFTGGLSGYSFSIRITVLRPLNAATPTFSSETSDRTCYKDLTTASLTCYASVTDHGTLSYQWYQCSNRDGDNATPIEGATSRTYTPPNDTLGVTYYYCVVTNYKSDATGSKTATATSNVCSLTVEEFVFHFYYPTKNITVTVTEGEWATLRVETDRASRYVWYCDTGNGDGWRRCSSLNAASTHTTQPSSTWMTGYRYKCVVTSQEVRREYSSPIFTLKVVKQTDPSQSRLPVFTLPAKDMTITAYVGDHLDLTAQASNATRGEWFINRNDGKGWVLYRAQMIYDWNLPLTIPSLDYSGYRFRNRAYNQYGGVDSHVYTLKVLEDTTGQSRLPRIITPTKKQTVTAYETGSFQISVTAANAESYQWFIKTNTGWSPIGWDTNPTLTLWGNSQSTDGEQYKCRVSNQYGYVDSPVFTIKVVPHPNAPVITSPTKNQVITVYEGDPVTLTAKTKNASYFMWAVSYDGGNDWYKTLVESDTFTIDSATLDMDGYIYYLAVSNEHGYASSPYFTLRVLPKDAKPTQPPIPPQTGDGANPALWLAMALLSLTVMTILRKRRNA